MAVLLNIGRRPLFADFMSLFRQKCYPMIKYQNEKIKYRRNYYSNSQAAGCFKHGDAVRLKLPIHTLAISVIQKGCHNNLPAYDVFWLWMSLYNFQTSLIFLFPFVSDYKNRTRENEKYKLKLA